jgi:cell wall-associated NlpC family hydrolase
MAMPISRRCAPEIMKRKVATIRGFTVPGQRGIEASLRDSIINIAMDKLGAPYHFGSPGPNSFDCSGFARYVYKQAGISLLRSSREQYKQGEKVEGLDDMSAGDLVFFARRGNIYHVGIVVSVAKDHFKFIHASYSGIIISDSAEPYYRAHYYGAKKIII